MATDEFNEIRPYFQEEIPAAVQRIANAHELKSVLEFIMPEEDFEKIKRDVKESKTKADFQKSLMDKALRAIANRYTEGVTAEGMENLSKDEASLFFANHRDIILDSSFLGMLMLEKGFEPCEMTWGDNLMVTPFIVDVGKVNGMITVFREGTPRKLLKNSQRLSAYIREAVLQRKISVWIAHRKGRAKDGNDKTDVSVLKMLLLSGTKMPPLKKLTDLNIRTVTVSYEWEPCDSRKVKELYYSQKSTYIKEELEDLESIIGGVLTPKGHVRLVIGNKLSEQTKTIPEGLSINETVTKAAEIVDLQIYKNYKLWPTNYFAYDLLHNSHRFEDQYESSLRKKMEERYRNVVQFVGNDNSEIRKLFLNIYANPVSNKLKYGLL